MSWWAKILLWMDYIPLLSVVYLHEYVLYQVKAPPLHWGLLGVSVIS